MLTAERFQHTFHLPNYAEIGRPAQSFPAEGSRVVLPNYAKIGRPAQSVNGFQLLMELGESDLSCFEIV